MALFGMLGTELKSSTVNHPQTDGHIERINALLEEFLRHYWHVWFAEVGAEVTRVKSSPPLQCVWFTELITEVMI